MRKGKSYHNRRSPSGTSAALALNFVGTTTLDPRITFSRGTNATLTDSNGRIAWAPHNLLTNSEDFEAAAWARSNATVTANVTVAPDGTTTADKLAEDATTNAHTVGLSAGTVGIQETFSFYAKAAERTWCVAQLGNNGVAYYDLQNGVTGTVTGGTAAIVSVGNGWFRCSISATRSSNLNNIIFTSTANNTYNYAGTAGFGIFIWGAQLNVANAPVNLLTWSEQFDNAAWTRGSLTISANATTAPDGTNTADKIQETNANAEHYALQGISATAAPYTFSVYLKAAERTWANIYFVSAGSSKAYFDLANGVVGTLSPGVAATISNAGNGWWRCQITVTATAATFYAVINPALGDNQSIVYAGTTGSGIFLWGAQLNTGSTALPYVATTSSIYLPPAYNSTTPKNLLGFTQEPENAAWTKSNSYVQQNLLTFSDGTIANLTSANNVTDASSSISPSFANSIQFGDNSLLRVAYKQVTTVAATAYTLSIFVRMNDDSAPVVGTTISTGDFGLVFETGLVSAVSTVTSVGGNVYRVSATVTAAGGASLNIGVIKYTTQSAKGFRVTGYQLVQGSTAGDYTQTTSAAAPTRYLNWDGTLTGRKLVEDTATSTHQAYQNYAAPVAGLPLTLSVYAKAAERTVLTLIEPNGIERSYNLVTGVATGSGASMQSAGGGWWRCIAAGTAPDTATRSYGMRLNNGTTTSYTGDGTSGIYVSDFQLSNSASVDPYVYNPQAAAASAAYYGPRFDYDPVTLAAKGLLIEEQRTNLLTYSQDFSNVTAWPPTNITVTNAATTAPDGTNTAQSIAAATTAATLLVSATATVSATSATYSVYAKQGTGANSANTFIVRNNTTATNLLAGTLNYSTGVFTYTIGSTGVSVQNAGNGWWRLTMTVTSGVTAGDGLRGYVGFSGASETAGTFLYAWGAQLEAGAFSTSYIPTVASQVTRNADSASMLGDNFYTWYNPNQGTMLGEGDAFALTAATSLNTFMSLNDGTANNYQNIYTFGSNGYGATVTGGVVQANPGVTTVTLAANQVYKSVYAYQVNNFGYTVNGATVVTDTLGSVPPASQANLGSRLTASSLPLNGHIRRIGYYNTRLPDSTLTALTT